MVVEPVERRPLIVVLASSEACEVGRLIALEGRVSIGRSRSATVTIDDDGLSRHHVEITACEGGVYRLRDLASRNGTRLNGGPVNEAELRDGDKIFIGTTVLQFQAGAGAEAAVRESMAANGIALWEYHADRGELVFSKHVDAALGLPPGTLSGRRVGVEACVHPDDRRPLQRALQVAVTTPLEIEVRLCAAAGVERWVVLRGHPSNQTDVFGSVVDVTSAKRHEGMLTRTARVFESLLDGVAVTDVTGSLVDLNANLTKILGVTRAEVVGRHVATVLPVEDPQRLLDDATTAIGTYGRWTTSLRLPSGTHVDVLAFPLHTDTDADAGVVWVLRDVTETHRMATQIAFLDRLASLGTLSAGLAHEINNPLSYVLNNIETVKDDLGAAPEHAQLAQQLDDAIVGAQRIATIIKDLKVFSRADGAQRSEPTDIRVAVELALKMTGSYVRSRARVLTLIETVEKVDAVESRLEQVLVNLLINAAQSIPEGRAKEASITVWAHNEAGGVMIDVIDTGSGMSADVAARAFEPFFTTKGMAGTGLGLPICHGLVTGMGGKISLSSSPAGTRVSVWLRSSRPDVKAMPVPVQPTTLEPRVLADARRMISGTIPPVVDPNEPRLRVLVVDDEPLVARTVGRLLRGHEVSSADGFTSALQKLVVQRETVDVVVCDLMMPDGTGIELHARVAEQRPELASRFIFITGGTFTETAQEFLRTTTNPHLLKPVDRHSLRRLVLEVHQTRSVA